MPTEIENYVHRIGRTGRCGKTGVATTFINKSSDETTLLDLKHLLKEARQRIPPVLMMLDDPRELNGGEGGGCSFCGGLGHTIGRHIYTRIGSLSFLVFVSTVLLECCLIMSTSGCLLNFLFLSWLISSSSLPSIVDCPKIDKDARRVASGHKDALATGEGYGGDW